MSRYIFLFDLDSTVTKQEILPTISKRLGIYERMSELTESTMRGEIPFKQSFLQRVELLKDVPVSEVNEMVSRIQLNNHLVDFIQKNHDRCHIVTGNLDVWVQTVLQMQNYKCPSVTWPITVSHLLSACRRPQKIY